MKKAIALCSLAFLLCSCAGVHVQKPEVNDVKKVAILSVSASEDIKKLEDEEESGSLKDALVGVATSAAEDNVKQLSKGREKIITHGADALAEILAGLDGWTVVPAEEVAGNADVQKFFDPTGAEGVMSKIARLVPVNGWRYMTPQGMHELPYETVVSGETALFGAKTDDQEVREKVGTLCESLNVDAVAVAEYYFFYEDGLLTLANTAKPVVMVDVVLIDKKGNKLLFTDHGWTQVKGNGSVMLVDKYVDLQSDTSVDTYVNTIDKAMSEFKKAAKKKL
jgi:hypothetical protein